MPEVRSTSRDINDHHNLYQGERCFIIASGPSLLTQYREFPRLRDEWTFGISSLIRWDGLSFWPTFYYSQELRYWYWFNELLDEKGATCQRIHSNQFSYELPEPWIFVPTDGSREILRGHFNGFEDRLDWVAGGGGSGTLICAQIACFMGFEDIYLVGCDATSQGYVFDQGQRRNTQDLARYKHCAKIVQKIMLGQGRLLMDSTPGGALEIPKRPLAEVLTSPVLTA